MRRMAIGAAVGLACVLSLPAGCGASRKTAPAELPEVFWRCRQDGFRTNLAAITVRQMTDAQQCRTMVQGSSILFLLKCPACGKMEMEQIMLTPEGEVRP